MPTIAIVNALSSGMLQEIQKADRTSIGDTNILQPGHFSLTTGHLDKTSRLG